MPEPWKGDLESQGTAGAASPAPELRVRLVTSEPELDALESAWSTIHRATGASVFQSFEWQRAWWRHVGSSLPGSRLHVVVLASGPRVVSIAPLFVHAVRAFGVVSVRRLAFLGTGLTDHLDVLAVPGHERACAARLARHLAGARGYDVLALVDIPDPSPTHRVLHEALEASGFRSSRFVSEQCPRTQLRGTWKETLEGFEGNHRRQLAKRMRQLREGYDVQLEVCTRAEDVAADVDAFMAMHQHRWTSVGKKGVYADPGVVAFQREIAERFFRRGWLFLAFLRVQGRRIVAICGFKHRGELAYYLNGVADAGEVARFSPGMVMHGLCMERLVSEGVGVYDFLRGTERYKYELGARDVPNWSILAFRGRAPLARLKSALALLSEALARRVEQERLAFAHQRREHGLLSAEMARHVGRRLLAAFRDGTQKLRAPERALEPERTARRQARAPGDGGNGR